MGKRRSDSTISRVITAALGAVRRKGERATPRPPAAGVQPQWTLELLRALEWKRFETLCTAYFEDIGYRTRAARAASGEGLELALSSGKGPKPALLAHCWSRGSAEVGVKPVRELLAAMAAGAVAQGVFVARGSFSEDAQDFAAVQRIRLVDGASFLKYLNALLPEQGAGLYALATEGDYTTPTCPACGLKMKPRPGRSGEWTCASFPVCSETLSVPA